MADTIEIKLKFAPPTSSTVPYMMGDHVQLARIGTSIALTFHQVDLQQVADTQKLTPGVIPESVPTVIVARVVMDVEAFTRLLDVGQAFRVPKVGE